VTPEAKVKARVIKLLKERGAYYAMPVAGGFGNAGVPDILVCYKGKFIGIECKAGRGQTTALQDKHLEDIKRAGGISLVVREDVSELVSVLCLFERPAGGDE
jgi:Holliday junction resolvase